MNRLGAAAMSLLMATWSPPADAAQTRSGSKPTTVGNPGEWFVSENYPPAARRAGVEGRVVTLLSIDASGAMVDCTIRSSSGSKLLDDGTCDVLRSKARFRPARDRRGRPIAGTYPLSVRWALEEHDLVDSTEAIEAEVSADGNAVTCRRIVPADNTDRRCPPHVAGMVASLPVDKQPYALDVRTSLRRGETPVDDQLPPAGADVQFLRVAKIFVNELGNAIECTPIERRGFDEFPDCPTGPIGAPNFGIPRGIDGQPTTTWAVTAMYAVKRSAPARAP